VTAGRAVAELDARAALADEVRALVLAAGTSDVGVAELDAVRGELAAVRARLERAGGTRSMRSPFEAVGEAYAAGRPYRLALYNGFGIPLEIHLGDGSASAELVADARHEGPPGCVHGGVSAWLMDSMLGLLLQARGRRGVTATLETRYHARTPLGVPLRLHSRIGRVVDRKIWIEGAIEAEGVRTVTAEGLFIELPGQGSPVTTGA
jgi:acyl-coenzyme A thioesterase PaaI-like protein